MKTYRNIDTNEIWTLEEIKEAYEQTKWDTYPDGDFPEFEDYLDELLAQGRAGTGGLVEVE